MAKKRNKDKGEGLWYRDAVIYELHIKAFRDGNGDGIGDFSGLTRKLDYLKDLGVTALWLLPFYPSPLKDDGYDTADFFSVHPRYGTLADFKKFLAEAQKRGLKVITELVLNHTSDRHPWFQRARTARPGSVRRDYYVWSDTPEKFAEARIIFQDFETSNWSWDPKAKAYYWHRFYSHQPDLNYDNPRVRKEIFKVIDYWFSLGVDGLRLDAVPYLYEREGTNCENLPETHAFLKKLRAHIDKNFKDKMLLAEANQWPEDAVAYFGDGDECQMAFHFPLMPRMFMAIQMEDRFPIIDILEQTPPIPDNCQWAVFLRNHDELTLEMVTDEERDYMWRIYAEEPRARINLGIRRRLAPLLNNDRRKIELLNVLLFTLPGTPVIYYGDEIGMGDNYYLGDRDGVRTPMQWDPGLNAGFSEALPARLYLPVIIDPEFNYEAINVENQQLNPSSLLWWMKRIIAIRKRFGAFGRGKIEFLQPENHKVMAFVRTYRDERVLVVSNLSHSSQVAELDLKDHRGLVPEDVFSENRFPPIGKAPYLLSLGPYGYYILALQQEKAKTGKSSNDLPQLTLKGSWGKVMEDAPREALEGFLPKYLPRCRWFGGKARAIHRVKITESIPVPTGKTAAYLLFLEVHYIEGHSESYLLPVSFVSQERARKLKKDLSPGFIAKLSGGARKGLLYDGTFDKKFLKELLALIAGKKRIKGKGGELIAAPAENFRSLAKGSGHSLTPHLLKREQSNSSIIYGDELILKLYRRLETGKNPELEIVKTITETAPLLHVSPFAGEIEYRGENGVRTDIGLLQGYLPNEGDGWEYMLDVVCRFYEKALATNLKPEKFPGPATSPLEKSAPGCAVRFRELIGELNLQMVRLLGQRTAELHLALASAAENPDFAPEPFTMRYQRSVYQSMLSQVKRATRTLDRNMADLPPSIRKEAERIAAARPKIDSRLKKILERKISGMRTRIHGDYHLGQVLFTGKDFAIIDFEGEPTRPLFERRLKRSPLRDVSGMLRSFHYAAYDALFLHHTTRDQDVPALEHWGDLWYRYVSELFLHSYLETMAEEPTLLPRNKSELKLLLRSYTLEKAVYELNYELNNRPDWLIIPLRGIRYLIGENR